ncbi:MAG: sigma factor-like helix-turn-helix DNA-binding protein [Deltaproteobacteria bacterium]
MQEIGDRFGISRERARQIEGATIKKLKGLLS